MSDEAPDTAAAALEVTTNAPLAAVVRSSDRVCINVIVAETSDPAPAGCYLVDVDNVLCDIDWIYDPVIGDFTNPNPPEDGGV
jgi:hypothetical protein